MTALSPRPPYNPDELKELYPNDLQLRLVQILFRHGERTPVSARFQNTGLPAFWPYCRSAAFFKATILNHRGELSVLDYRRKIETFGMNGEAILAAGPTGETEDICPMGELTDTGRETTLQLGQRIRHLYMDQLGFLPRDPSTPSNFYLRSSPISRTLSSLHQVLCGIYPLGNGENPRWTILTRSPQEENLFTNSANCRRFNQLEQIFADLAAKKWNNSPEMQYLQEKIGKYVEGKVAVDGHPRLSGIMDTVNSTLAHGPLTRLPPEFYEPHVRQNLNTINVDEWFSGYGVSSEYRKLGIGPLLADLRDRIVHAALTRNGSDSLKLALYGTHDTTIAAILASLGAFGGVWPQFTSNIAIELFSRQAVLKSEEGILGWRKLLKRPVPEEEYFVRIRYNDEPVTIPGCKPIGLHLEGDPTFCTLEAFKKIVLKITPADWKYECRQNLDKTGVPPEEPVSPA